MKIPIAWLLSISGILCAAPDEAWVEWQWEAMVEVGQAGIVRLEIPPAVLDVSKPHLDDLRLLSPGGVETPYVVQIPREVREGSIVGAGFRTALLGKTTVIEVTRRNDERTESLELLSPAREFLKSVTAMGLKDGAWQTLAESAVIFRQAGGAERLRIPISEGAWEGFRIIVDDGRTQPIPFTEVRLISSAEKAVTVEYPVVLGERKETLGETRLSLDLGARNLNVEGLRFEIDDAVFSRVCKFEYEYRAPGRSSSGLAWGDGMLYRVAGNHGVTAEKLVISPDLRRVPARELVAIIRNGDSPPLAITGVKVRCYPTVLIFHASDVGAWRLLTGNRAAKHPIYGLSSWNESLAAAGGQGLAPGALTVKADYQAPPALPGVEPAGAEIGLEKWSRRRPLDVVVPGVIRVDLDARAMATCRGDLGDVRLVQNGRQIPYLIKRDTELKEIKPTVSPLETDPKRPTVSRWKITLPVDGLPATSVSAHSSAPMFTRRFVASIERKDELGNKRSESIGVADWTKSGTADTLLSLDMRGVWMPRTFTLETDHGDNPPIPLDEVIVKFAAPAIAAKLTDSAPVFLYYGNPDAKPPQYDLVLVRSELMAAEQVVSTLGDEETLKPDPPAKRGFDVGSPWLWLALGGVVVALLVIVAKLLPKPVAP